MEHRIKIAIQKSGRLSEDSIQLLRECGVHFDGAGKGSLVAPASNFPIDVLYLRDDDIPQYIQDGIAHVGIVGENVLIESRASIDVVKRLDFGKCRLSLAVPRAAEYAGLDFFNGKRIATSYPVILDDFLKNNGLRSEVHTISGSVEIAPNIGLADAICDLVSSGSTLLSNGLKEVEVILKSEAVMAAHPNLNDAQKNILRRLLFRIDAVRTAIANKYIIMNVPDEALDAVRSVLPGIKSPTVTPLAVKGWSAMHSVVSETHFWEIIDELKRLGAQGILVVPIEKMIV